MRMLTILAVAATALQAAPLSAAELVPYEAEYRVALMGYVAFGNIESFEGLRRIRLSRDCQKWKLNVEVTHTYYLGDQYKETYIVIKHYEALDGSRMEYDFRMDVDGDRKLWRKGSAKVGGPGKPGTITYRKPDSGSAELPAGTLFSLTAEAEALDHMTAGKERWTLPIFNLGALVDSSYTVTERGVVPPGEPTGDVELISRPGWVVKVQSYDQQSNILSTETEQILHDTGVSSANLITLATLMTREDLVRIKRLPTPQC